MPTTHFKNAFPKTRVIIDCTEILVQMPTSCRSQCVTFSSYNNHSRAKGLLGIAPTGYPCFVFKLYVGRITDKKITHDCGMLDLLEEGDQIIADRGFDIADNLPAGVTLNITAFLNGDEQLTVKDEITIRRIASVRVHVKEQFTNKDLPYFTPSGPINNVARPRQDMYGVLLFNIIFATNYKRLMKDITLYILV